MVKLGVLNSRVKDFFDIWLLSRQFDFDGGTMALAMRETFVTRGTAIPSKPVAFADDFANAASRQTQWQGFVRKNRLQVRVSKGYGRRRARGVRVPVTDDWYLMPHTENDLGPGQS